MRTFHCRYRAGFTLVELLVAISVFSLVIVLLFAGFRLANRGWDTSIKLVEKVERPRLAHGFIRRYLESAVPLWRQEDSESVLLFSGTEDSLRFVSGMPAHLGEGGLYVIDLAVKEEEGKEKLLFSRSMAHPDLREESIVPEPEITTLVEEALDISFAYFGAEEEDGEDEWMQLWEITEWLPKLVRLTVRDEDGRWMDLVVPIFTRTAGPKPKYDRKDRDAIPME